MTFDALLTNLRHASTNSKVKKITINLVVVFYCYCNVYDYSSE